MNNLQQIISNDFNVDPEEVTLKPLQAGASSKRYFILSGINKKPDDIFLLMQASMETVSDVINIEHFFRSHGIRSPKIIHHNLEKSYVIMEYCGDVTLERIFKSAPQNQIENYYINAIDLLLALQLSPVNSSCIVSTRAFDRQKFLFEHEFHFCLQLITNYYNHTLAASEKMIFDVLAKTLVDELSRQPFVFVHRDFQSSNLLVNNQEELIVIDFQDARMGTAMYDLVSLVEDVYVLLQPELKRKIIEYYRVSAQQKSLSIPIHEFSWIYDLAVIQRKLHDAGAFVYCFENFGNNKYMLYIEPVVQQALEVMSKYPIFARPYELLTMLSHASAAKKQNR